MRNMRAIQGIGLLSAIGCFAFVSATPAQAQVHSRVRVQSRSCTSKLEVVNRVRPGSWSHVDEMAAELEELALNLHDEVHHHLVGHVYFRKIDWYAEEIERLAKHIHYLAHHGRSIRHLQEDVVELDELIHDATLVISRIGRFGVSSEHFDGAVRQTVYIAQMMNSILHHLEADLAELDPVHRHDYHHDTYAPVRYRYRQPSQSEHYRDHRAYYPTPDPHRHHDTHRKVNCHGKGH